ncbi:DUF5694 domain-containing protein [Muriicola sp. Z0-33]|uniref:DUF5694 domain-containing protein n=1 Tax=Muriicola sp. Z0-33 TaxID=2816957 RepID=UPI0022388CD2|nr:DUF5694 domain-containing protein [Muriicola sp. Z0-33]MCW5515296.1 hypothetical protein [Muriicola sp. Z0-33]
MSQNSFLITALLFSTITFSQAIKQEVSDPFAIMEQSELYMLGTFHFKDAGLDGYKPKHDVDIMSAQRQKELEEVLNTIRRFAPTKIAVEWNKARQAKLDSIYNEYLAGRFQLTANEIFQIGFRMAKELGHKKIYAMDATARNFDEGLNKETYKDKEAYFNEKFGSQFQTREEMLHNTFMDMYAMEDKKKTQQTLLEHLLEDNSPERIRIGHGHYLIGNFKMNEEDDYFGADGAIWWYTRNLRIFSNLLTMTTPGKDKLFVLIGAGHLPILNFLADASPDYRLVRLEELIEGE